MAEGPEASVCSYGGQVVVVAHGNICHAGGLTAWLGRWDGNFATSDEGEMEQTWGASLLHCPGQVLTVVEHLMPKEMVMSTVVAVTTLMSLS